MSKMNLETMRHSAAHILAAAVLKLYPQAKLGIGPSIEDGFYYDFDFGKEKITEEDLQKISDSMIQIMVSNLSFIKEEVSISQAKKTFSDQSFKLELIADLETTGNKTVSIYKTGDFLDLCQGPHVEKTSQIGPFKLLSIAGAYWKGSEKNKMLTRIYGTAFETQEELDKHLGQAEEAKKRDHRKLNQVLNLYFISDDLGQGLVTLLPNGAIIAEELEKWAKVTEKKFDYVRVFTPHIASEKVFKISGHVPYYLESMYPPMRAEEKGEGEKDVYYLKPMNCATHHLVFKSQVRSYRDLPLRIAEYGTVYRYEKSGELYGMMRARGPIHQNDAHIFCTEEQADEEFAKVMELHKYYYETLGLTKDDYYLSFAIRDKKNKERYLGDDKIWDKAEKITLDFIKKSKISYEIETGGAAFYGPKIDFCIKTVTGKVFAASTNQLDFFLPQAFGLKYIDSDGKEKTPVCIHRAPLGAHIRFIAFLTEHFAGAFPLWLTPCQIRIIPIADRHLTYGREILNTLLENEIRAELDDRNETTSAKVRDATLQKVPYMVIIGDREIKESGIKKRIISIRTREGKDLGQTELTKFVEKIKLKIEGKVLKVS